jgi:hypothetical protein
MGSDALLTTILWTFTCCILWYGGDEKLGSCSKKTVKQFHFLNFVFYTRLKDCKTYEVGSASKVFALVDCSYQFEIHGLETKIVCHM